MNLTFIYDGYLAETALESSFLLFCFDGYLIYGEIPPPSGTPTSSIPRKKGGHDDTREKDIDDKWKKKIIVQSGKNWEAILKAFLEVCQN